MENYKLLHDPAGRPVLKTPYRGVHLLRQPLYNKGTAFTREERERLGLTGLLPSQVNTMEQQVDRVRANILRKPDALERYIGLAALQDRNEHLFYRVLADNLEELLPIVYTPTVGRACQEYSRIFRRGRGLWITPEHRGHIYEVLSNAPYADVRLIVVTDNERILGLGDQGAGGMGIPIGKLALYVAAAGIHPAQTLPISLDVGTDNQALLADELYLGYRAPRLRGAAYDALIDEFVQAVKRRFPKALLQWEDFKKGNALRLLNRYRQVLPSFNDDVQGTAAVAVAGVMAGSRASGIPLRAQRTVILGAGAAGIGIARLLRHAVKREGLSGKELTAAIALVDTNGLLTDERQSQDDYKQEFGWPAGMAAGYGLGAGAARDLAAVVAAVKPTVLIGTSGVPGAFGEAVVRTMAAHAPRPLIFPLSNPTSSSEAHPQDLLRWTDGRALVATGSPFEPVVRSDKTVRIGQANNVFIFPGVGLGALCAEATEVTDALFVAAADELARCVADADLAAGSLFPRIAELRSVTARIAAAVVRTARDTGVGRPHSDAAIPGLIASAVWEPRYPLLQPAE